MVPFSTTFKVISLFNDEYLINGRIYRHSYNELKYYESLTNALLRCVILNDFERPH